MGPDYHVGEANQLASRPRSPRADRRRHTGAPALQRVQEKKETHEEKICEREAVARKAHQQIEKRLCCDGENKSQANVKEDVNIMHPFASGLVVPISTVLGESKNQSQPQIELQRLKRPLPSPEKALHMLVCQWLAAELLIVSRPHPARFSSRGIA